MKRGLFFIFILLMVGMGVLLWQARFAGNSGKEAYRTAKVERGDLDVTVSATGTLNPVTTVYVGSQVTGMIQKLSADYNSQVKEGEVIAQIDPDLFTAAVHQKEALVDKAKVAVADSERNLRRAEQLLSRDLISQKEKDDAQRNYDSAVADEKLAQAELEQAQVNLKHTTIKAPVSGVVITRNVDVGQTVTAGLQTPTLFTIAQDLSVMQIDSDVDEADVGMVAAGQEVDFTVDAFAGRNFKGTVKEVRNTAKLVQNVVTYDVVVSVENADLLLRPGMTATSYIRVARKEDVLKVPQAALRFRPPNGAAEAPRDKSRVFLVSNGKLAPREVAVGLSNDNFAEVLSGLKEGEKVVTGAAGGKQGSSAPRMTPFGMRFRF